MGESYRRLIPKPADISDNDAASLADRLAQNVRSQRELAAQSPHVLQFTSDLQHDDEGFFVEHEPAKVRPIAFLDSQAAVTEDQELLRWAVALADALRVAHNCPSRIVHGGLCPGVILVTSDGVQKITDFGFAPSICATLGVDSYVNLCLQNRADDSAAVRNTGVWRILSPDVEHDDRICGFVDPQKYGNQTLHTFEGKSDIIGAGFLLHLMAEHRHPYLHDNQDLRLPELAEAMAFFFYDGSRRKSLQNSSDERIKVWCEIVATMLEHLPADRPDAAAVTTRLAEVGVEPHSLGDAQAQELESIAALIAEEKFDDARGRAQTLAAGGATEEIAEKAKSLLRSAEAGLALARAFKLLNTDEWQQAQGELATVDRSGLQAELIRKADDIETTLKHRIETDDRLQTLESSFREATGMALENGEDAKQRQVQLDDLLENLTQLSAEADLPKPLVERADNLRGDLDSHLIEVQQMVAAIDADHAAARDWLSDLQREFESANRDHTREMLSGRKELAISHWPEDVLAAAVSIEKSIEEAEQAEAWITRFTDAVEAAEQDHNMLEAAQSCIQDKPKISEWPKGLREPLDALSKRLADVAAISADHASAGEWIESIQRAVAAEDWVVAHRSLNAKPSLRYWSDESISEEERLKPIIDAHLEEQERVDSWLQSARSAGDADDFAKALGLLTSPPVPAEKLPKAVRKQATSWQKEFQTKLEEARQRALQHRSEVVREKTIILVRQVLEGELAQFLSANSVEMVVDPVEWDSADMTSAGHGELTVTIRFDSEQAQTESIQKDIQFELNEGLPRILNEQSLRDQLVAEMRGLVHEQQSRSAATLAEPLRKGLFPDATIRTEIAELSERITAKISFLGQSTEDAPMDTPLVWDQSRANWAFADPESVVQRAVDIATASSRELLKPKLLEASDVLRRYGSVLQADVTTPSPPSPPAIPRTLTLQGRLTIILDDDETASLMAFPVSCTRAGEVAIAADLAPAEAKLNEIVVARQQAAQATIRRQLEERLKTATIRCKLTPLVKRIKTPVDEVGFLLKPKRGEKVTLTAQWNRERFLFELGAPDEAALKAVLNGSVSLANQVAGAETAIATAESTDSTAVSTGKRPAVVIVGGVVLVAVAAATIMLWPDTVNNSEGGQPKVVTTLSPGNENTEKDPTPLNDNGGANAGGSTTDANANDNGDITTVQTVPAPEAAKEIRDILSTSTYLENRAPELVDMEAHIENEIATIGYRIPGLKPAKRNVRLVTNNETWSIGFDGVQGVVQSQQTLTSMLDANRSEQFKDVVHGVINSKLDQFVTPGAVSVASITPSWDLDESGESWVGQVETATITINDTKTAPIPGLSFTAKDGSVSLVPNSDLDDAIESALNGAVAAIQRDAVDEWLAEFEGLKLQGARVELEPDTNIVDQPRREIYVLLEADRVHSQRYGAAWNRSNLTFESQDSASTLDHFARALAAINRLNDRNQPLDWVQQVPTIGMFREGDQSNTNELHVVTTAPWADDSDDVQDPLDLRILLDSSDSDIPMPRRWPLVVRYLKLVDQKMIVGPADQPSTVWTGLPAEFTPLVNADLATIQLDAVLQGKPQLTVGDSPQLNTQIDLSWGRSSTYSAMSAEAVRAGIDELTSGVSLSYDLSLTLSEENDDVALQWASDADNPAFGRTDDALVSTIVAYDRLLQDYPDRQQLEAELASRLSQVSPAAAGSNVKLDPAEALSLLVKIWKVKSALTPGGTMPVNLRSLSDTIRNDRSFTMKGSARDLDAPTPTIFAEYFCGPRGAYAIVWSLSQDGTEMEDTSLVKVGTTADLLNGQETASLLFEPMLATVPKAVTATKLQPFAGVIGVIIALDGPLKLLQQDFATSKIAKQITELEHLDGTARGLFPEPQEWTSLADLRDKFPNMRSDYKFVQSLNKPDLVWRSEENAPTLRARKAIRLAETAINDGP